MRTLYWSTADSGMDSGRGGALLDIDLAMPPMMHPPGALAVVSRRAEIDPETGLSEVSFLATIIESATSVDESVSWPLTKADTNPAAFFYWVRRRTEGDLLVARHHEVRVLNILELMVIDEDAA